MASILEGPGREIVLGAVTMQSTHDPARNLARYREFIELAGGQGVRLLVFPEASLQGYLRDTPGKGSPEMAEQLRYFRAVSEPVPGPTTRLVQEYAARYDMLIQIGMAESALDGDVVYNSAVLVGPEGVIGVFRKLHNQAERPVFGAGDHLSVFGTPLGKIGMFICYDLCFPETTRTFALQGAWLASLSTAWPMQGEDPETDYYGYCYDLASRANAFANQMWMVCANQVMRPPSPGCPNYYGHSRIIAPTGLIVADGGYAEGLVTARVDLEEGIECARTFDFFGSNLLQDRRPAFYNVLTSSAVV